MPHLSNSHQQSTRLPVYPYSGQHVIFWGIFVLGFLGGFLILAILMGVSWYLICISMMISVTEHLFMCLFSHLCFFFGEVCIQVLCPFVNQVSRSFPLLLHSLRTAHLVTTEGSFQKVMAGDRALCWLPVYLAIATNTVTPVTLKRGSVWYAGLFGCLPDA